MFLKKCFNKKTGKTQLSIAHGYRDKEGKSRQKTVMTIGFLEELTEKYDDPIAHFTAIAKEMTKEYNEQHKPISIEINQLDQLKLGEDNVKNIGYFALSTIYHELKLERFFNNNQRGMDIAYNLNNVMKLLVYSRILFPNSKKSTFELKTKFFDNTNFSLHNIYDSLSRLHRLKTKLLTHLYSVTNDLYEKDNSLVYYDVTNYYFEINNDDEDKIDNKGTIIEKGFRKKGISKEHRPKPIVQMGMFLDSNHIPMSFELFDGNTPDTLTLRPCIKEARLKYGMKKVIVVADKGLNSGDNILYLKSGNNGYVLSKSVRNASADMKNYVLEQKGYRHISDTFKIKSKLEAREIYYTTTSGRKRQKLVDEKIVVIFSEKYQRRARYDREKTLKRAFDLIANPTKYSRQTSYGAAKYINNINFDKETGEIIETTLSFNYDKLKEDELLDGYYIIVSSEMDWSDEQILDAYKGLWRIEESFKITKSYLKSRPVFVTTKEHINAHFMTCFLALLIIRLLEKKLDHQISIESLIESLRNANCSLIANNTHMLTYYDENLQVLSEKLGIPFYQKYMTTQKIKKILGDTKKAK